MGVKVSDVLVSIKAGSVGITAIVVASTEASSKQIASTFQNVFSNITVANSLLNVTAESTPTVEQIVLAPPDPPFPPSRPPPMFPPNAMIVTNVESLVAAFNSSTTNVIKIILHQEEGSSMGNASASILFSINKTLSVSNGTAVQVQAPSGAAIDAGGLVRHFDLSSGSSLDLRNVSLFNGRSAGAGGSVLVNQATLNMTVRRPIDAR